MATQPAKQETVLGVDKIRRYGWGITNQPGALDLIDKKRLDVGAEYQREANHPKVLEIASNWDWIAAGVIVVAKVRGKFRVIDGQHRVLGACKRSDIALLPCIVFETQSIAQEARGFLALNTLNKPVGAVHKHKAKLIAEDPTALKIQETLDEIGLSIVKSASGPGQFGAVAWAYRKAQENFEAFRDILKLAAELCLADGAPIAEKLVDGLWYLNDNIDGGVTHARLRQRLYHVGAQRLIDGATRAAAYFTRGGSKVFAQGMLEVLNKGVHYRFEFVA